MKDGLTVSEVAKLSGVTVRTLHHYDELGLVRPSGRSAGGYRLYGEAELRRLQSVLFFRELEFPLEEIAKMLSDKVYDVHAALLLQRQLLEEKSVRVRALIAAVDRALLEHEGGAAMAMTNEERFEVFGNFDPGKYEAEAKERWGGTEAYRESARRTKKYGKKEWAAIKDEASALSAEFVALMKRGVKPTDPSAMALAERHRAHISKWFYPCSHEIHRGLGEMYVADPRFTENIDKAGAGLAAYQREAFLANAKRAER